MQTCVRENSRFENDSILIARSSTTLAVQSQQEPRLAPSPGGKTSPSTACPTPAPRARCQTCDLQVWQSHYWALKRSWAALGTDAIGAISSGGGGTLSCEIPVKGAGGASRPGCWEGMHSSAPSTQGWSTGSSLSSAPVTSRKHPGKPSDNFPLWKRGVHIHPLPGMSRLMTGYTEKRDAAGCVSADQG